MKRLYTTIIIGVLVFSSYANFVQVGGQETTPDKNISALSVPNVNGFIDTSKLDGYLNEWDDSFTELVSFKSENGNTIESKIFTKFVSGNIYGAFEVPSNVIQFGIQIDVDGDGKLSTNDILFATASDTGSKLTTSLGLLQSDTKSPELTNIQAISIFDGSNWVLLQDFLDLQKNTEVYAEMVVGIFDISTLTVTKRLGASKEEGTQMEFRFNPALLASVMKDRGKPVEISIDKTFNYGIILVNEQFELFGYPQVISSKEGSFLESYSPYIIDFELIPTFRTNIGVNRIEVTQAVQYEDNSLSLINNKPTLARVFVSQSTGNSIPVTVTLSGYLIFGNSFYRLGSLSQICDTPQTPDRNVLEDSCNFLLPNGWTSNQVLVLQADVSRPGFIDTDIADNTITDMFTFKVTKNLNVYYINANIGTEDAPIQLDEATIDSVKSSFVASMPMATANFIELDWDVMGIFSGDDHDLIAELNTILGYLAIAALLQLVLGGEITSPLPDLIFGFRPGGGGHSDPGWNNHGPKYTFAATGGEDFSMVMAHEFNHNLGPGDWGRHVSDTGYGCRAPGPDTTWQSLYSDGNIHALGWAPGVGLINSNSFDYMTYCSGASVPESWVSDYRWEKLVDRLNPSTFGSLNSLIFDNQLSRLDLNGLETNALTIKDTSRLISGSIRTSGEVTLNPSFELPGYWDSKPVFKSQDTPSHYLSVQYANKTIVDFPIYTDTSEPDKRLELDHEENMDSVAFSFWLPDNGEIVSFEIYDIVNQKVLFTRKSTGFSSQVIISTPTKVSRGNPTLIKWDYSLSNTTTIYSQLQYSPDNEFWYSIGKPISGTSLNVDFGKYPGSNQGNLRLLLSDGFDTQLFFAKATIYLEGLAPKVNIIDDNKVTSLKIEDKAGDSSIQVGSTLSYKVKGYDPEDGDLTPQAFNWQVLDANGIALQTGISGDQFSFTIVKEGIYKIVVIGQDSEGKTGQDSVTISVETPKAVSEERYKEFVFGPTETTKTEDPNKTDDTTKTNVTETTSSDGQSPVPLPNALIFFALISITFIRRKKNDNSRKL